MVANFNFSARLACKDLQNNLYEAFYLNFTSYISRDGLEQLAQAALATNSHVKIARVSVKFRLQWRASCTELVVFP